MPPPVAPRPARVAYQSPAQAARDVADLLPPVVPPPAAPRPQGPRYQAPGQAAAGRDEPRQPDWQPPGLGLLSLSAGVAAVALSVLLPVAGTAISLAVITLLRAADRAQHALTERRSRYGARPSDIAVVIVTAPWTVVRAALTTVLLSPLAIIAALPCGSGIGRRHQDGDPARRWQLGGGRRDRHVLRRARARPRRGGSCGG